jgi:transcriptional regulator with XRE-family HTH domain
MLGNELRKARIDAKLTQEQLAARAGLTREYISILEGGKKSPTVTALAKICKVCGIRVWQLMRRVEERTK